MSHDQQNILAAYDDAIGKLYATLWDEYAQQVETPRRSSKQNSAFRMVSDWRAAPAIRAVTLVG